MGRTWLMKTVADLQHTNIKARFNRFTVRTRMPCDITF